MQNVQVLNLLLYHLKQFPHFVQILQSINLWKEQNLCQLVNRPNLLRLLDNLE